MTTGQAERVRWPRDDELRQRLTRASIPVLLLVDPDVDPPHLKSVLEDWIRLPAQERDIVARAQRLARLAARLASEVPVIDEHRVMHREGGTAVLSASEARLAKLLLTRPGAPMARDELESKLWPDDAPVGRSLDALVYRLRSRVAPLGLRIRAVRGRGFVLDVDALEAADAAKAADAAGARDGMESRVVEGKLR